MGLAGGSSFDFHSTSEHLFIVGTEEGKIHKCSKAYNSQYLDSYNGHYVMPTRNVSAHCKCVFVVQTLTIEVPSACFSSFAQMSVYAVHWNKFHSRIFLSSSADWTVKVWVCVCLRLCERKGMK